MKNQQKPTTQHLEQAEHEDYCLNCHTIFKESVKFCPQCGQRAKVTKITFKEFISELLSGLINYDSKLWRSLGVILSKPGKFPKDYINGKQARYMNPFRLYLNITVLFFLLYGLYNTFNPSQAFTSNKEKSTQKEQGIIIGETSAFSINALDSIISESSSDQDLDSLNQTTKKHLFGDKILKIDSIQELGITNYNTAFTKLGLENTAWNRFLFKKVADIRFTIKNIGSEMDVLIGKFISQLSISLFILIPLFTLFFKIIYYRKHMYFMEHMVFIFNIQTCFMLLAIILLITTWISGSMADLWWLFPISFGIYLFIALKNFYNQGYLKTFIKYCILNTIMINLVSFAMLVVMFTIFLL